MTWQADNYVYLPGSIQIGPASGTGPLTQYVGQPSGQVTGITTANGKTLPGGINLVGQVSCNAQGLLLHTSWSSTFTFTKAAGGGWNGVGSVTFNLGNANLNKKMSWTFKRHFNKLPQ